MKPLAIALVLAASPALAIDVPSGQQMDLQEVLVEDQGSEIWLRFRFIAPQIARETGDMTFETAEPDMTHLCEHIALPYIADYSLQGQVIVISLADRAIEFGQSNPDATQFFEAYRRQGDDCIWEGI